MYFEDPCVRPGIMNLAVRKGLWAYMQKYVAALRAHTATGVASEAITSDQVRSCLCTCFKPAGPWFLVDRSGYSIAAGFPSNIHERPR